MSRRLKLSSIELTKREILGGSFGEGLIVIQFWFIDLEYIFFFQNSQVVG